MSSLKENLKAIAIVCLLIFTGQAFASSDTKEVKPAAATQHQAESTENAAPDKAEERSAPNSEIRTSSSYEPLPYGKYQPWQMIRRLQKAQDLIANGTPGALEKYRTMLVDFSRRMLRYQRPVWSHERNLDAAAVYVLIGGNPQVGTTALERSPLGEAAKYPLKAAIAYSERNIGEAYGMMNAIDPAVLPASLAGQFALARAMVTSSSNLQLATKYLNIARKLAPGTLIEEASLRRHLRITGRARNFKEFKVLSSIYMRRFGNSHYINDFLRSYAYSLTQMPSEVQSEILEELRKLLKKLNERQVLIILTYVARNATITGKTKLANWTANKALEQLRNGSKLHTRMKLYAVASGIVNEEINEASSKMLTEIDSEVLDANDKKLFDAVSALSLRLQSAALDANQVRMILRSEQQTFPGEDPKFPAVLENQAEYLSSNVFVMRFEKLSKNYKAAMPGAAK